MPAAGLWLLYAAQMLDGGLLPVFPGGRSAPRPGASNITDRGRRFPGASGLYGMREVISARGAASLLFRRLQGRGEPPEKPGTHEENEGEKAGRRLRFAAPKGLIFGAFLRVFPGREYCNPSRPGFSPHFVTYTASGHAGPRHRKEASFGNCTRLCHFENHHF